LDILQLLPELIICGFIGFLVLFAAFLILNYLNRVRPVTDEAVFGNYEFDLIGTGEEIEGLVTLNPQKFRRHHIRMVAAIHYFMDITLSLREWFDTYLVKKNYPNEKEAPLILRPYAKRFPKLKVQGAD